MTKGFPCGSAGKESPCNVLVPGLGKERPPTPVFWPGEFHGLCSSWCSKESERMEQLSLSFHFQHDKIGSNIISILHGNKLRPRETLT